MWLEDELKDYHAILVLISHSQDFLNGVCTNMMQLQNRKVRRSLAGTRADLNTADPNTNHSYI